jgi:hypothetical protein
VHLLALSYLIHSYSLTHSHCAYRYIVIDHLKALLRRHDASHDPNASKSFGRKFNATRGQYYAGGSGIIMNRAALRKLGRAADADYVGTCVVSPLASLHCVRSALHTPTVLFSSLI